MLQDDRKKHSFPVNVMGDERQHPRFRNPKPAPLRDPFLCEEDEQGQSRGRMFGNPFVRDRDGPLDDVLVDGLPLTSPPSSPHRSSGRRRSGSRSRVSINASYICACRDMQVIAPVLCGCRETLDHPVAHEVRMDLRCIKSMWFHKGFKESMKPCHHLQLVRPGPLQVQASLAGAQA